MKTMPTRIDGELFEAAKAAGELHSRSAAQQLHHWAKVGREVESSPGITHQEIERVLAGQTPYDEVSGAAQAAVRVAWDEQIASKIAGLDLQERFESAGLSWVEAAPDGNAVHRNAGTTDG